MERIEAARQAVVDRCGMSPSATTVVEGATMEDAICKVEGEGRASELLLVIVVKYGSSGNSSGER